MTSPLKRAQATAQSISKVQSLAGYKPPKVQVMEELTNRDLGEWEGWHALEVWATTHTLPAVVLLASGLSSFRAAPLAHL